MHIKVDEIFCREVIEDGRIPGTPRPILPVPTKCCALFGVRQFRSAACFIEVTMEHAHNYKIIITRCSI